MKWRQKSSIEEGRSMRWKQKLSMREGSSVRWQQKMSVCVVLSVIASLCVAGASSATHRPQAVGSEQTSDSNATSIGYVLREHNGYIAVYPSLGAQPEYVTRIEVKNLREVDRDLLEQGIAVDNKEALMSLLEDLGS